MMQQTTKALLAITCFNLLLTWIILFIAASTRHQVSVDTKYIYGEIRGMRDFTALRLQQERLDRQALQERPKLPAEESAK